MTSVLDIPVRAPLPAAAQRAARDRPLRLIRIMGIDFAATTEEAIVDLFVRRAMTGEGCWVVTANMDHLRRFASEPATRALIEQAEIVVADGMPIVAASRLAGLALPERIAGSSMVRPIARRAAQEGASVFLLGGEPGVADRAATELQAAAPGLRIAGTLCPPHGFEDDPAQLAAIEAVLLAGRPDIVLLALSFPKTDRLIAGLRPLLPGASFMGIGIALSFVAGDKRRAPTWMRRCGIEWLHRLLSEPRRLWRRYLVQGIPFAARLLTAAGVSRLQRSLGGPWFHHPGGDEVPTIGAPTA